jgi:hypothetical protein
LQLSKVKRFGRQFSFNHSSKIRMTTVDKTQTACHLLTIAKICVV